jgi:hypothetical protein
LTTAGLRGTSDLLVSEAAGGAPKEKVCAGLVSATCEGFSWGFGRLNGVAGVAIVGNGVAEDDSFGFFSGVTAFLCTLSFAIASASRSCFSHFENDRYAPFGLDVESLAIAEATRRPDPASDCWKGLMRRPRLVAMD